jgi:hypothetical protein
MTEKNQKETATNNETRKHIVNVAKFVGIITTQLQKRATEHDESKLGPPELELFTEYTPKLAETTYGSKEYKEFLKGLGPALQHHYAKNRHHPEHYPNGINDMTLIDLVEMFCDWKAATLRHHDGNILKSIEQNTERFKISEQLAQILKNTAELFEHVND